VPFRSNPRKIATDADLYAAALRALMRRSYSLREMKQYLARRAKDETGVTVVLMKLQQMNYLNDARYALEFARSHAKLRRQGRYRIARDLRARGVSDADIDAALSEVFAENDEASLVRARLRRRLSHMRGPVDEKKLASLYRMLLRAGFSSDVIRNELRAVSRGDLPDLPD